MKFKRSSGILLHPTSLPGKYGIGTLGKECFEFIDFLIATDQKLWQILPLGPTGYGDSPYQCFSAFAGNPLLINLEKLKEDGLLSKVDLDAGNDFSDEMVDYGPVINFKKDRLKLAYTNLKNSKKFEKAKYQAFCKNNDSWLNDYTLFISIKEHFNGKPWYDWDDDIRLRKPSAITKYKKLLTADIEYHKFLQYEFFKQWNAVKSYANTNGINIIGDIPIFVAMDSCDAWSNAEIFHFDKDIRPTKIAGVPPDYFSKTGQLWGNPLYNWDKLRETKYKWWIERVQSSISQFDYIRIDHFRGFAAYWAVPAGDTTAENGVWEKAYGHELFDAIKDHFGELPVLAEDLGHITPDVYELRDHFKFPGMKILQFGFNSEEGSPYIPHLFEQNCVVYTGVHDNETIVGWFKDASENDKHYVREYLSTNGHDAAWDFIRAAWASVAVFAIIPLQDTLSLDNTARMNTPGVAAGNWKWRFKKGQIGSKSRKDLRI